MKTEQTPFDKLYGVRIHIQKVYTNAAIIPGAPPKIFFTRGRGKKKQYMIAGEQYPDWMTKDEFDKIIPACTVQRIKDSANCIYIYDAEKKQLTEFDFRKAVDFQKENFKMIKDV